MRSDPGELPYLDEHRIRVAAPRAVVWPALRHYAASSLRIGAGSPLTRLLGTVPRAGFEVAEEVPEQRLGLAGRHRFSRYRLVFALADLPDGGTLVSARSYAVFPGWPGRGYRALVIGTRLHVVAVRNMLRSIRRASLR